jgi:RNA-splicing ligase RtcB
VTLRGALMPDTCPTGPQSFPVGGIVESTHIMPGGHSADVCCSLFLTRFDTNGSAVDAKDVMDAVYNTTHFGTGPKRNTPHTPPQELLDYLAENSMLTPLLDKAIRDFGTQGDGNHFAFIGTDAQNNVCLVTHHGSRGLGAGLYKQGMKIAQAHTSKICPELNKQNAWIPEGQLQEQYWDALQRVRYWTFKNHQAIHTAVQDSLDLEVIQQVWNEHNFVFKNKKTDMFLHAKGATPAYKDWYDSNYPAPIFEDQELFKGSNYIQIIPMNMAEPILLVQGGNNPDALGFAPHGAGRNLSRTQHKATVAHMSPELVIMQETEGLDVRFYSGLPDISELPSAYKHASTVRDEMENQLLAFVHEKIYPYGSIMNGENPYEAARRAKKSQTHTN